MNNYGYNKAREQKIFESWFAKYEAMLMKEGVAKEDIKSKRQVICWIENHFKKIDNYIEN